MGWGVGGKEESTGCCPNNAWWLCCVMTKFCYRRASKGGSIASVVEWLTPALTIHLGPSLHPSFGGLIMNV